MSKTRNGIEKLDFLASKGLDLATEITRLMSKMPEATPDIRLAAFAGNYAIIKKWCEDNAD